MAEMMADGLLIPFAVLALLGWIVPKLMSMVLPEGVWPLLGNAALSVLVLMEPGLLYNLKFFGRLALGSTLIWGPIMLLSLAGLPRTWTKAVW